MTMRLTTLATFALCSLGCGSTPAAPDAATVSADAALADDASSTTDAPTTTDAPSSAADASASADAPGSAGTSVAIRYGMGEGVLDRAWLGYHRTGSSDAAPDGLYFELSRGADGACPSETSPVPAQIVTIDGFAGAAPATRTEADGLAINFFDFEGTFFEEIRPMNPSAATITVTALDLEAGTASGEVTLTFGTEGDAAGSFVATHCDSLDTVD
ncbi:MAG: hypothetical protein J0L92_15230 [Deltaproteobacteria bacterium]|nr:hypothetical protein [Deltaproteobacteria bacterium]